MEEFKNKIHVDIKTHIDEQKVNTLEEAAVIADDYAITHKVSSKFTPRKNYQGGSKFTGVIVKHIRKRWSKLLLTKVSLL